MENHAGIIIFVCLMLAFLIWYLPTLIRTYIVDDYFFRESVRGRTDFKYAKIIPYTYKGYYVVVYFGRDKYILQERDFTNIYGAKVQGVMDDLCWDFRIPKGSLYSTVSSKNSEVLIKKKGVK